MADETSRLTVPEDVIEDTDSEILANISELNRCWEELARQMKELFVRKDVLMEEMKKFRAALALFNSYQDVVEDKMKECLKKLELNFDFDVFVGSSMVDRDEILAKISTIDVDDEVRASISELNRCCEELDPKSNDFLASMKIWKEENEKFKAAIEMFNRDHDEVKNRMKEFISRFGDFSDHISCIQELDQKMDKMEKDWYTFQCLHNAIVMHCDISTDPPLGSLTEKRPEFDIGEEETSSSEEIESNPSKDGTEIEEEEEADEVVNGD